VKRALAAAALVLAGAAARAQDAPAAAPIPEGRPPEWGLQAGYGFSFSPNGGRSHEYLFLFEPNVGIRLGARFEYVAEAHFARYFSPEGSMVGVVPVGARYNAPSRGAIRPYFYVGVGLGWTDLTQLDEIDRRFNFLIQGSVGLRGAVTETQAWTFEARYSHVSNAGTELPNLGLNCLVFLAGWRF
jgi:lipid A 3-O-deacylase PagL